VLRVSGFSGGRGSSAPDEREKPAALSNAAAFTGEEMLEGGGCQEIRDAEMAV
jgi:hypothetical protein